MLPSDLTVSQIQATQRPVTDPRQAPPDQLRQSAEAFEAVFISQMMAPMFEGLNSDGLFGGGHSEDVFRSFLVDEIGKQVARQGGIGIADQVHQELLALQEM